MFCSGCGNKLESGVIFCSKCGAKIEDTKEEENSYDDDINVGKDISKKKPHVYMSQAQQGGVQFASWKRLFAYVVDIVVLLIPAFVVGMILGALFGRDAENFIDFAMLLLAWVYYATMESSSKQATFGKLALGLKVTDENFQPITFGKASARFFSKILSGILLLIGYLMIFFTEKHQGLHDKIAKTYVIYK